MKRLFWLGDSLQKLKRFPLPVQDSIGYALYLAQIGTMHRSAKPLHGLGNGIMEISSNDPSGAYRAVYAIAKAKSIYVLHTFQKKSKSGIATPKPEIEVIRRRLQQLKSEVNDVAKGDA